MSDKNEKYVDIISQILASGKTVTKWEEDFLGTCQKMRHISIKQCGVLDKMKAKYIEGKDNYDEDEMLKKTNAFAEESSSGGYQCYVNRQAIGECVSRKEAMIVVSWLDEAAEDIAKMQGVAALLVASKDPF